MFEAMEQLGNSIGELGSINRQKAADAATQKRQRSQDFQAAYLKAKQLADAGDLPGAAAVMAPFKGQAIDGPMGPGSPQGMPTPQMPMAKPQGGSAMPDGIEARGPEAPGDFDMDHGQGPGQMPGPPPVPAPGPPPLPDPRAGMAPSGPQLPADNSQMLQGPQNPLFAAQEGTKARESAQNQQRARQLLRYETPEGQQMTYDPVGAQEAQRAERARVLDGLVAESNDPKLTETYQKLRPWLLGAKEDIDPGKVFRFMQAESSGERQDAHFDYKREHDSEVLDEKRDQFGRRISTMERGQDLGYRGKVDAAALIGSRDLKVDAQNRGDSNSLERAVRDLYQAAGGKQELQNINVLHAAHANINATGPKAVLAHKDAMIQLARYFRGTTPTEGEMKLLYDHLGGTPAAMDTFIKRIQSGDISTRAIENLRESAGIALRESEAKRSRLFGAMRERFGPGSDYENMGPQVNRHLRAYGMLFGLDNVPDLYDEAEGAPKGVQLASGTRPNRAPKKAPKAAPAPEPQKPGSTTPVQAATDAKYIEWAKANRGNPDAEAILKENGIQ